jgi:uncharacterized membrane protein YeaQ/YmgE (transglycosylase-associated protein family)
MDTILQIFFGAYAGWMISSRVNPNRFSIPLGILGAMASSMLMKAFGLPGVYAYNTYSFFVAITGAVSAVHIGRLLQRLPFPKGHVDLGLKFPILSLKPR